MGGTEDEVSGEISKNQSIIWGHMYQAGDDPLQGLCEGLDSLCLHQIYASNTQLVG